MDSKTLIVPIDGIEQKETIGNEVGYNNLLDCYSVVCLRDTKKYEYP